MASARHLRLIGITAVLLVQLALAGGSGAARISYIPEGGDYSADELPALLENADTSNARGLGPDEVPQARQDALADLRTHGDDAAALADALTSQFPVDVNAVPVEIHRATYEGEPAWIVVESWGDDGEPVTEFRLWVFSADDLDLITAYAK